MKLRAYPLLILLTFQLAILKRSRCKNSSYRKFVLKKPKTKQQKNHTPHQKKCHTQTPKHKRNPHTYAKKSRPAPFQVFYTTRSITSTAVLATLPTKSQIMFNIQKKTQQIISCSDYLREIILVITPVLCLKRILLKQVYRKTGTS